MPLRSGEEQFGLLNVASSNKQHYSEEDLELLESVAFQIGSAIKRILLTDREKEAAKINERNRLARDLSRFGQSDVILIKINCPCSSRYD